MPRLGAGLPNIGSAGAGGEQPLQLFVLTPVGGIHIDVQTQLACLGLVSPAQDDCGLWAAEADSRRPDLYVSSDAFQLDIAQYVAPEPREQFGITCVQDQFGYAACHLITITLHADHALRPIAGSTSPGPWGHDWVARERSRLHDQVRDRC